MNQNDLLMLWCKQYIDSRLSNINIPDTPSEQQPVDLSALYPVGAVYISTVATNPAELFGFGEWTQIKDTFLLAAGDTYAAGATGGEATVTLTVEQMPSHTHGLNCGSGSVSDYLGGSTASYGIFSENNTEAVGHVHTKSIANTGGSQPHNNMPPYLAVYMWQRVQ